MKTNELSLIVLLADGHTLKAAGRELGISQPYATNMLKGLEAKWGETLYERAGNIGGRPTDALLRRSRTARKILALLREME